MHEFTTTHDHTRPVQTHSQPPDPRFAVTQPLPEKGRLHSARIAIARRLTEPPAWVVLIQLFIGLGWLRAVAEKLIDPQWWTGEVIVDFVAEHQDVSLGWYTPFLENIVLVAAPIVAIVVVLGQLAAGLSLTLGKRLGIGLAIGMFLNLNFIATGAVAPSAFYLLAQGALALWLVERMSPSLAANYLRVVASVAVFFATASLPFISTVHPAEVIDDPAVMFVFGGALTALSCVVASEARPRA